MGGLATLTFANNWLPKLVGALHKSRADRAKEVARVGNLFGDPFLLARFYVEPDCQQINPASYEDEDVASVVSSPAFNTIRAFLERSSRDVLRDGRRQLFVLADAGMGKTSLLMMLKLMHLHEFWPSGYNCELIKLGRDAVPEIEQVADHARTVLLLDSLDEDPLAWGRSNERILELLQATKQFMAVIITCRTQFFPMDPESPEKPGMVIVGAYRCPSMYMSPFSDERIRTYLKKRFPRSFWRWMLRRPEPRQQKGYRVVTRMDTLAMRPMLLAYIDDLMNGHTGDGVLTTFEAFSTLVDQWLAREERISGGKLKAADLASACLEVARELDRTGKRNISSKLLRELADVHESVRTIESIHLTGRSLLNRTAAGEYRFAHFALQEFLLAREIAEREPGTESQMSVRGSSLLGRFVAEGARAVRSKKGYTSPTVTRVAFRDATFAELDFSGVYFDGCTFVGADLRKANLSDADLLACDLSKADLEFAGLLRAGMYNSVFRNATLRHADLSFARTELTHRIDRSPNMTTFEGANLTWADLHHANLSRADLTGADLSGAKATSNTEWPKEFDRERAGVETVREPVSDLTRGPALRRDRKRMM